MLDSRHILFEKMLIHSLAQKDKTAKPRFFFPVTDKNKRGGNVSKKEEREKEKESQEKRKEKITKKK